MHGSPQFQIKKREKPERNRKGRSYVQG